MPETRKKSAYNIVGAIIGVLLAGVSIFSLVEAQNGPSHQKYSSTITYDG